MRSRLQGSNLVLALPWCFSVPNLVKMHQIFFRILRWHHIAYAATINDREHENTCKVKVTWFKLDIHFARCLCVPNLVRGHQIFLQISSGNHFKGLKWPSWPWKWAQGHKVWTWSLPWPGAYVYQIWWAGIQVFIQIFSENHLAYARLYNIVRPLFQMGI